MGICSMVRSSSSVQSIGVPNEGKEDGRREMSGVKHPTMTETMAIRKSYRELQAAKAGEPAYIRHMSMMMKVCLIALARSLPITGM